MDVNGRLAPTPSGYLHSGNAFNFLLTDYCVHRLQGTLRLRIDDLDATRVNEAYLSDIFDVLHWLEIPWEQGPRKNAEHHAAYSQTHRRKTYDTFIERLIMTGRVYACSCSRASLKIAERCSCSRLQLALDTSETALRISTEHALIEFDDVWVGRCTIDLHEVMHDFVIRRKDGIPAYQIASLADDLLYQTTLIVRGRDLLTSTAAQIWLGRLLDLPEFSKVSCYHHPLLTRANKQKLSKSAGDISLKYFIETHQKSELFYQQLSPWFGLTPVANRRELHEQLDIQGGTAYLKTHFNNASFWLPDTR
ncbi:MAG: glutamate--tRNA ligase family protein [Bacteroidia bacterium]|jgi:glutamyl-tRNA synthetase